MVATTKSIENDFLGALTPLKKAEYEEAISNYEKGMLQYKKAMATAPPLTPFAPTMKYTPMPITTIGPSPLGVWSDVETTPTKSLICSECQFYEASDDTDLKEHEVRAHGASEPIPLTMETDVPVYFPEAPSYNKVQIQITSPFSEKDFDALYQQYRYRVEKLSFELHSNPEGVLNFTEFIKYLPSAQMTPGPYDELTYYRKYPGVEVPTATGLAALKEMDLLEEIDKHKRKAILEQAQALLMDERISIRHTANLLSRPSRLVAPKKILPPKR